MTRTLHAFALIATLMLALSACKTDDSGTVTEPATEPAAEQPTTTPPVAESQPAAMDTRPADGVEPPEDDDRPFGQIVEGATKVTVTQELDDGAVDFGGKQRVLADAAAIAKLVEAMGAQTPGTDALPKCVPHYSFAFGNETNANIATFSGVCSGQDVVIMVRGGRAYQAKDGAAIQAMIKELATAPAP